MCFQFVLIPKVVYRAQKRIQRAEQKVNWRRRYTTSEQVFQRQQKSKKTGTNICLFKRQLLGFIPVQELN